MAWRPVGNTHRGVLCGRSRTAVAPLERLKILMQVQGKERVYRGVVQVRRAHMFGAPCSAGEAARRLLKLCETPGAHCRGGSWHCLRASSVAVQAAN